MASDTLSRIRAALDQVGRPSSDFDLNPGVALPENRRLRHAGVLVAVSDHSGTAQVILTKRASALKHHPGQIAFPGGKQEEIDADIIAAALREAEEEIALDRSNVEVLGTLPAHETVTGFIVTPVVARVIAPFTPRAEPGEVAEVFNAPLAHLMDSTRFSIESRRWRGQRRHYYTVPYGPYYIWGATARILRALADRMEP